MITSLRIKDRYRIGIGKNGKMCLGEDKVSVKDVPFVRYAFDSIKETDGDYIKNNMFKFPYSTHLVEISLGAEEFSTEVVGKVLESLDGQVAVFGYIDVDNSDVENGSLVESKMDLLKETESLGFDRIILKDVSTTLHMDSACSIKKDICKKLGITEEEIGICNSPLSVGADCCLNAVLARKLAADYAVSEDCALPSSNHEDMIECGCIRYFLVETNINGDTSGVGGGKKAKVSDGQTKKNGNKAKGRVMKAW